LGIATFQEWSFLHTADTDSGTEGSVFSFLFEKLPQSKNLTLQQNYRRPAVSGSERAPDSTRGGYLVHRTNEAHFTLGIKAHVQLKSSIPIGEKVEISPNWLYTMSQGLKYRKKSFQSAPSY
jgi:hypothetical protein